MTIHLMDILLQFLPEYDHCSSRGPSDEQINKVNLLFYWQLALVCGSVKLQIEAFTKCLTQSRFFCNSKILFKPNRATDF